MTASVDAPRDPGRGAPLTVTVPPTLSTLLREAVRAWPERVALDFLGAQTTYAELGRQVELAAGVLHRLGVRAGDRVALVLPNCPQHVVAFYAVASLGATVAEHNPVAAPEEVRAQLAKHGARVVIAWEKALDTVAPGGDTQGRTVLAVDLSAALPRRSRLLLKLPVKAARTQRAALRGPVPSTVGSWEAELRAQAEAGGQAPLVDVDPESLAVLLPTGGTTGTPKLVMLTHANLMSNVAMGRQWLPGMKAGEEVFSAVLPFFHAFGLTLALTFGVQMGATQVVLPRFDAAMMLAAQKRRPMTFIAGVPPIFDRLEAEARKAGVSLTSIGFAISGAMALDGEIARRWEETTRGLIIEGYGMTESSPVAVGNPFGPDRRPGTLGIPFPGTSVRIADPDLLDEGQHDAPDVPDGEVGELLIHGPQVFAGYLDDPEETAQVLLPGRWLRTGDLVRREPDGFIVLADRRKELIISGGFNVYPSQVEEAVRVMPGVIDVAVVGMPDASLGEQVVAALVTEPGVHVELDAVREWLKDKVSRYAIPRSIHALEELPRSQLGKVLRRQVREHLLRDR
ncbi:AMP-binding protein [Ornithinimicrobium panacihumi]|uniref:AMP-binding protein n=1 Tax=Ornithinimicrobium panacihumi TaxID=2008449 RepID=UPI003F8AE9B1